MRLPGLLRPVVLAVLVALAGGHGAWAKGFSEQERAALEPALAGLTAAYRAGDTGAIIDAYPGRLFPKMAEGLGSAPDALRDSLIKTAAEVAEVNVFVSFEADLALAKFHELPDGRPYVLIPSNLVTHSEGADMEWRCDILGMIEEATWRFTRLCGIQTRFFQTTYPEFSEQPLGVGTLKELP